MDITRDWLERELQSVRAQKEQFMRAVEQANGAEAAFVALLGRLDQDAENQYDAAPAAEDNPEKESTYEDDTDR